MTEFATTILRNIHSDESLNGEKLTKMMQEVINIFKRVNNIESMRNTGDALKLVVTDSFKKKLNELYINIEKRVDVFDKEIMMLNGNREKMMEFIFEMIKKELNDMWQIYTNIIGNEISNEIEICELKIEGLIREEMEEKTKKMEEEIKRVTEIEESSEIGKILSKSYYREQVNMEEINKNIKKVIDETIKNNSVYLEYIEKIKEGYKNELEKWLSEKMNERIKYLINEKPVWKETLMKLIWEIDKKYCKPFINEMLKTTEKNIDAHISNNLEVLKSKIEVFIAEERNEIMNEKEFQQELKELYENVMRSLKEQKNYLTLKSNVKLFEDKKKLIEKRMKELEEKTKKQMTIPNGVYMIVCRHTINKVIDVPGASKNEGQNIQIYDKNCTNAQRFEVVYNSHGQYYTVKCKCSGKYLTTDNSKKEIFQSNGNGKKGQQWHIVSCGEGYVIVSELNGKYFDVNCEGKSNGTKVICHNGHGRLNQQFLFEVPPPPPPPVVSHTLPPVIPLPTVNYFSIPSFRHPFSDPCSIVDGLKSVGYDSSFQSRARIAAINRLVGNSGEYKGTASQNVAMLNLLKQGKLIKP